MANLKEDLAALKIDHSERGASGRTMLRDHPHRRAVGALGLGGWYLDDEAAGGDGEGRDRGGRRPAAAGAGRGA